MNTRQQVRTRRVDLVAEPSVGCLLTDAALEATSRCHGAARTTCRLSRPRSPCENMVRGAALASNLPQLQRLIKIDPHAYREEFLQQWNHYNTIRQIFFMDSGEPSQRYRELVSFISQARMTSKVFYCAYNVRRLGRKLFPQGDSRFSRPNLICPARQVRMSLHRDSLGPGAEPCHSTQERGCNASKVNPIGSSSPCLMSFP